MSLWREGCWRGIGYLDVEMILRVFCLSWYTVYCVVFGNVIDDAG